MLVGSPHGTESSELVVIREQREELNIVCVFETHLVSEKICAINVQ
jgi:hypothetical protein